MSFNLRNLSVLAYANGFTLWHYKTKDTMGDIESFNYFSYAGDMLTVGDLLMVSTSTGASIKSVTLAAADQVDVSSLV